MHIRLTTLITHSSSAEQPSGLLQPTCCTALRRHDTPPARACQAPCRRHLPLATKPATLDQLDLNKWQVGATWLDRCLESRRPRMCLAVCPAASRLQHPQPCLEPSSHPSLSPGLHQEGPGATPDRPRGCGCHRAHLPPLLAGLARGQDLLRLLLRMRTRPAAAGAPAREGCSPAVHSQACQLPSTNHAHCPLPVRGCRARRRASCCPARAPAGSRSWPCWPPLACWPERSSASFGCDLQPLLIDQPSEHCWDALRHQVCHIFALPSSHDGMACAPSAACHTPMQVDQKLIEPGLVAVGGLTGFVNDAVVRLRRTQQSVCCTAMACA